MFGSQHLPLLVSITLWRASVLLRAPEPGINPCQEPFLTFFFQQQPAVLAMKQWNHNLTATTEPKSDRFKYDGDLI